MSSDQLHPVELPDLEVRLRAILPETYQDTYEDVQPVSMGSAGLRFGADGKVAWDEMWATFCDLAMAGGPPHKGLLLEPGRAADIAARPSEYSAVVDELLRGIRMVTELDVEPGPPGWVRVTCEREAMSAWLLRAIVMENVAARATGVMLELPAGPDYRLEKEIKNVITVIAKTCHYWMDHIWPAQHRAIGRLFDLMAGEHPLIVPADRDAAGDEGQQAAYVRLSARVEQGTSLAVAPRRYGNWLGVECPSVRAAVWMMRMVVVSNVLARREGTVLFVPVNAAMDPDGVRVAGVLGHVHRFAQAAGVRGSRQ